MSDLEQPKQTVKLGASEHLDINIKHVNQGAPAQIETHWPRAGLRLQKQTHMSKLTDFQRGYADHWMGK